MRVSTFTPVQTTAAFGAVAGVLMACGATPLIAFGGALGLLALLFRTSKSGTGAERSAAADAPPPSAHSGISPASHVGAALIAAAGFAVLAFVSSLSDLALGVLLALAGLGTSRAVLVFAPASTGELGRLAAAHIGGLVVALLIAPHAALTCLLWQIAWLAIDMTRVRFVSQAEAAPAQPEAQSSPSAPGLPHESPANDATPMAAVPSTTHTTPNDQTTTSPRFAFVATAAVASVFAVLVAVDALRHRMQAGDFSFAGVSQPTELDELWEQSPLSRRAPIAATPAAPVPTYGSRAWACAQAPNLAAYGLNTLAMNRAAARGEPGDDGWIPAVHHFAMPPLTRASDQLAERVFGAACPEDANVRVLEARRARLAPGYRHDSASSSGPDLLLVGAVHALDLPDGRQLLLARAWRDTGDRAPSLLLMAFAPSRDNRQPAQIWIASNKGDMGVAGALFAPAEQPLGGYHLWYGGMSPDGVSSFSSADIIDVSGSMPRNTGAIPIWGASLCGQVVGDLLLSAEPNCVEQPAWAFWLTDFRYAPDGADEVRLTLRVRQQYGEAGEPATYEEAFEDTMYAQFVLGGRGWRFVGGEGALLADAGFAVAPN